MNRVLAEGGPKTAISDFYQWWVRGVAADYHTTQHKPQTGFIVLELTQDNHTGT
jgi:hypothetical protein